MTLVAVVLILAVVLGGVGLLIEGLLWLLALAVVLMVVGALGYRSRART